MADAIVGTKTMLLLNFRPGLVAPWMQRSHYCQISLAPLESRETGQLLSDLIGDDPSLALISRNIAERAQGNPFFLEELVHSLVERGDFAGERGAYRLKGGIDVIPLPVNVQAVLGARIDRLPDPSRHVLQAAAVIGREIPLAILGQVTALPPNELAQALWRLRQAELLYELPPFGHDLHAFRHPLIQEVAYRSLLHERCRQLHGAVARAMEVHFKDRLDEQAGLLAYHLEQAGAVLEAAQANVRAAIWVGANDPSQALRTWKRVRELLVTMPSNPTVDYLRMMASGQIVNFGWREGISPEDAKMYFEEASQIALVSGNMRAGALIYAGYGRILGASGSADDYVDKIRKAEALARESIDASLQVTLKAVLCHALRLSGRMLDAIAVNTEALEHVREVEQFDRKMLGFDIELWLVAMRGQTLVMLGRESEARPYLDRILAVEASQIDIIHHVIPSLAYVDLARATGDAQLAKQHAERAFSMAMKSGSPYLRVYAQAARGLSHVLAGRLDEAIRDLTEALGFARRRKAGLEHEPRILADLADAHLLNGDFAAAISVSSEAIHISTLRRSRGTECLARIVKAQALHASLGPGRDHQVDKDLARSEELAKTTGLLIYAPLLLSAKQKIAGNVEAPRKSVMAS
jgi:tetratricopeptide (TPR) repeat protein